MCAFIITTNILHKFNLKNDDDVQISNLFSKFNLNSCEIDSFVDGRNPKQPPGMCKTLRKKRDKLPLVFSQDF